MDSVFMPPCFSSNRRLWRPAPICCRACDIWWPIFAPLDASGVLAAQILAEIRTVTTWGGEPQIRIAASLWRCQFDTHTRDGLALRYGSEGECHHLLYHNRSCVAACPSHYDVLWRSSCPLTLPRRSQQPPGRQSDSPCSPGGGLPATSSGCATRVYPPSSSFHSHTNLQSQNW